MKNIKIDKEVWKKLKILSVENEIKISDVINMLLKIYNKQNKEDK